MSHLLTIDSETPPLAFSKGKTLLEILQDHGRAPESPCAGKGTCGKCRVKILAGELSSPTEEETAHLTREELGQGLRLSCQVIPSGDVHLSLMAEKSQVHEILTDGEMPEISVAPWMAKRVIPLTPDALKSGLSHEALIEKALNAPLAPGEPSLLASLAMSLPAEQVTAICAGDRPVGIEPGDTRDQMYGIAVDIGTTTVVAALIDLNSGRELGCESAISPQKEYGLDVLSRIDFVRREERGLRTLQEAMVTCLNELAFTLARHARISIEQIYEMSVAANATMMHLLLGVDTHSIGRAPFATVFSRSQSLPATAIGLRLAPFARLYCLPGVSSYIGADIVAGVGVSRLAQGKKNRLLIDMGTNCELVLAKAGTLTSCSCAAGPALEGMNISCGMRAAEGAIQDVTIQDGAITLDVIGGKAPTGICGSGILSAISEISRVGLMAKTGRLKKGADLGFDAASLAPFLIEAEGKRAVTLSSGPQKIIITQDDIRQVQLAKGAILSGIHALLESMEIPMEALDEVIIAGQFGAHLSVESLMGIGILPRSLAGKIRYIGNASKTGARMCLLSKEVRTEMEEIATDVHYLELATKKGYERLFTRCLSFSETLEAPRPRSRCA
ncbi:ASKHA domain-containing protein [Desulfoluna sp.]|uniref:ASKHA domain-containing protein n=1 Tax=Desulfoluna sp. TaxID=2045199 RepID=UPI00262AC68D|nr:ASKHA domain-containing protein [Desulfoluna sp.]